jgi:prostaglandin-E synthase 1
MVNLAAQPAFVAYSVSLLLLSLNLLVLWAYSGAVRGKTKTTPNQEDSGTVARGAQLVETDPPAVARVLRAHKNAMANIVPFAILGLVFVLAGGSGTVAWVIFGVFTVARLAHSLAYLNEKQPWRTLSFALGGATTLVLMGFIVRALVVA